MWVYYYYLRRKLPIHITASPLPSILFGDSTS